MFSKGDEITLKKGSLVRSTNPSKREYTLQRNQTVKVHCFEPGFGGNSMYPARQAEVHWVGTGGYWCWTADSNVLGKWEIIPEPGTKS